MSDELNEIFGYKIYKPPKEELPMVPELNIAGEIVTMIDPSADVIEDATVQALLETMDGERTVKVEDLPPDMRYDHWNSRVEFDNNVFQNRTKDNPTAEQPRINQVLLQPSSEPHKPFSLSTARPEVAELVAQQRRQQEQQAQEFARKQHLIAEQQRQIEEKKMAILQAQQDQQYKQHQMMQQQQNQQYAEQAILYQIRQQQILALKSGSQTASAQQQATIQKLLLDLAKLNPALAMQTLQQFKSGQQTSAPSSASAAPGASVAAAAPQQVKLSNMPDTKNLTLVHSMGSIEPAEFTSAQPQVVRPVVRK